MVSPRRLRHRGGIEGVAAGAAPCQWRQLRRGAAALSG
jgi:hypothetical protein